MAQRSRPTISKRQREQARIAKQKDKAARRAEKATRPKSGDGTPAGDDPDIEGIRPGPQPPTDRQVERGENVCGGIFCYLFTYLANQFVSHTRLGRFHF